MLSCESCAWKPSQQVKRSLIIPQIFSKAICTIAAFASRDHDLKWVTSEISLSARKKICVCVLSEQHFEDFCPKHFFSESSQKMFVLFLLELAMTSTEILNLFVDCVEEWVYHKRRERVSNQLWYLFPRGNFLLPFHDDPFPSLVRTEINSKAFKKLFSSKWSQRAEYLHFWLVISLSFVLTHDHTSRLNRMESDSGQTV